MSEIVSERIVPNDVSKKTGYQSVWDDDTWCANVETTKIEESQKSPNSTGRIALETEVKKEWS